MMTIDIETISGVPLTGELKIARPKMSAQTRNPSRKMIAAAAASSARTMRAFRSSSIAVPACERCGSQAGGRYGAAARDRHRST